MAGWKRVLQEDGCTGNLRWHGPCEDNAWAEHMKLGLPNVPFGSMRGTCSVYTGMSAW